MADEKDQKEARETRAAAKPKTEKYRLRPGKTHFIGGRAVEADQDVELTERQATAFADKFEKASGRRRSSEDEEVDPTAPPARGHEKQDAGANAHGAGHPQPVQSAPSTRAVIHSSVATGSRGSNPAPADSSVPSGVSTGEGALNQSAPSQGGSAAPVPPKNPTPPTPPASTVKK